MNSKLTKVLRLKPDQIWFFFPKKEPNEELYKMDFVLRVRTSTWGPTSQIKWWKSWKSIRHSWSALALLGWSCSCIQGNLLRGISWRFYYVRQLCKRYPMVHQHFVVNMATSRYPGCSTRSMCAPSNPTTPHQKP